MGNAYHTDSHYNLVPFLKAGNNTLFSCSNFFYHSRNSSNCSPVVYPLYIFAYPLLPSASCLSFRHSFLIFRSAIAPARIQQYKLNIITTTITPTITLIISATSFLLKIKYGHLQKANAIHKCPNNHSTNPFSFSKQSPNHIG